VLEQPDLRGLDERRQRGEDERQRERGAVRPRVGPEAPEDLAQRQRRRRGDETVALGNRRQDAPQVAEPRGEAGPRSGMTWGALGAQLLLADGADAEDALFDDSDLLEVSCDAGFRPENPNALPCLRRRRWRLICITSWSR
jgi:hypothetical protein